MLQAGFARVKRHIIRKIDSKEGGPVNMELGKTFFSEPFGMVTDKFGITWQLTV